MATNILAKPVGPMPLGAWVALGSGGVFLAWKAAQREPAPATVVEEVPVPVGGTAVVDGAPLVMSPIVRINVPEIGTLTDAIKGNTDALGSNTGALGSNTAALGSNTAALGSNTTAVTGLTDATKSLTSKIGVTTPTSPPPVATPKPTPTPTPARKTYTIKSGDTLSAIAQRYTGSASRWPELYRANASVIDSTARARGKAGGGHWIFPGTVLVIPW